MIRMGLIGDLQGELRQDLSSSVNLAAYDASHSDIEGVVIDGQSAAGAGVQAGTVSSILQSGKTLALVHPPAGLLSEVRSVTGSGPSEASGVVIFARTQGGRTPYRCMMAPIPRVASHSCSSDGKPSPANLANASVRIGPILAQSLGMAAAAPGDGLNLVPPIGATYGYSSFQSNLGNVTFGGPSINSKADDKTAGSNNQTQNGSALTEFYVYYVDGLAPPNGNTPAYYIVILRQTGFFSCGQSQLAQNQNSRGWFQYQFQLSPNGVAQGNGQAFPSGVTMTDHTPMSYAGNVPVTLTVPMTVLAQTPNGTGPVQFTASQSDATLLTDWAVADSSSGVNTSWNYHEVTTWDPTQNPPDDFGSWWSNVYDGSDNVKGLPPFSCAPANINFETLTAWTFDASLLSSGSRSLSVQFTGGWSQDVAFLHNPAGCAGAEGSTHHHLFWASAGWGWKWTIDLGAVSQPT